MTHAVVLFLALLIGVVAGLRTFTAPAAVAWAAMLGWIALDGTWAQWLAHPIAVTVFSILAVGELVADQLPRTPSRKTPMQFLPRLISGGFAAAVIGTAWGYPLGGLGAGLIGAVLGTLGGYAARKRLVAANRGHDLPIALVEDGVAVAGGFAVAWLSSVV